MLDGIKEAITVIWQAIMAALSYQAGRASKASETQSRVIQEVSKAHDVGNEIGAMPIDAVRKRLRDRWTK